MANLQTFTAVQLAKEMKLPPKRLRAIIRKLGNWKHDGRWQFAMADKPKLKKAIVEARRKPAAPKKVAAAKKPRKASRPRVDKEERSPVMH